MTLQRQAEIILEQLDKAINVNWNMKDSYIKAIIEGLKEIQESKDK